LEEILLDAGRPADFSLSSLESSPAETGGTGEEWLAALNRALPRLPLRPMQAELTLLLARRALLRARGDDHDGSPPRRLLTDLDKIASLLQKTPGDFRPLSQGLNPQDRRIYILALTEQLRYTFGTATIEPFRRSLAQAPT